MYLDLVLSVWLSMYQVTGDWSALLVLRCLCVCLCGCALGQWRLQPASLARGVLSVNLAVCLSVWLCVRSLETTAGWPYACCLACVFVCVVGQWRLACGVLSLRLDVCACLCVMSAVTGWPCACHLARVFVCVSVC